MDQRKDPEYIAGYEACLGGAQCRGTSLAYLAGYESMRYTKEKLALHGFIGINTAQKLFAAIDALAPPNHLDIVMRDIADRDGAPYSTVPRQ